MKNKKRLEAAISKLADLFEYGHLQAVSMPADFIDEAATEIEHLRAENEQLRSLLDDEKSACLEALRQDTKQKEELKSENKRLRDRLDAYYYSFDPTGVAEIDELLSAVAWAGKMYHLTEDWGEAHGPSQTEYPTEAQRIQEAADKSAEAVRELRAEDGLNKFLRQRGVDTPCERCHGLGVRWYPSTATWHGGMGGASMTQGVCDECWGTGDKHRQGADLCALTAERAEWERKQAMAYLASRLGVRLSRLSKRFLALADLADAQSRKRKLPDGEDAFWWARDWEAIAGMLRRLVKWEVDGEK